MIKVELADQLTEIDRMLKLGLSLLPDSGIRITKTRDVDPIAVYVVVGLFVKALKTCRGLAVLAEAGLYQDAAALLRVLFETTLAVLFILQRNSRLRARMYAAHVVVKRVQILRLWMQTRGFKRSTTQRLRTNAEAPLFEAVRGLAAMGEWPKKHPYGVAVESAVGGLRAAHRVGSQAAAERQAVERLISCLKVHWSGGNIQKTAEALKWSGAYHTLYRYASPFAHAGDWEEHLHLKSDGGMILKLEPAADDGLKRILETAAFLLWGICSRFDTRFGLGRTADIDGSKPNLLLRRSARVRKARLPGSRSNPGKTP